MSRDALPGCRISFTGSPRIPQSARAFAIWTVARGPCQGKPGSVFNRIDRFISSIQAALAGLQVTIEAVSVKATVKTGRVERSIKYSRRSPAMTCQLDFVGDDGVVYVSMPDEKWCTQFRFIRENLSSLHSLVVADAIRSVLYPERQK